MFVCVAVSDIHRGGETAHDGSASGVGQRDHVVGRFSGGQVAEELHLVASQVLREAQGLSSRLHQLRGRGSVGRIAAKTQTDGEAYVRALGAKEHPAGDRLAEPLGYLYAALLERVGEDHGELVTPKARDQVDLAKLGPESAGEVEEDPIPALVAVPVVQMMEVVQVEHQQHEGVAETIGALALVSEPILEYPVAGHACEGVQRGGVGQARHLRSRAGVVRTGRHRGDQR